MPSEFKWNRLIIRTQSDGEFCAAFEENLEHFVEMEYDELECDLSQCVGIAERGVELIHWALVAFGDEKKHVTLRLPSGLQEPLQTTPIPSNVEIEWVFRPTLPTDETPTDKLPPSSASDSDRRKSSRPYTRNPETNEPTDTVKTKRHDASLQSQSGSIVRADTAALMSFSKGESPDTDGPSSHAILDELLPGDQEQPDFVGDNATTDRQKQVFDEEAATNEVKPDKGWRTSKWVDMSGMSATLKLDESDEERELGEDLIVGRDRGSDWVIDHPTVSKRHFRLFVSKNRWHIQDMDSTNGTFLNFLELTGPPVPIANGDVIALAINDDAPQGTVRFTFNVKSASESEAKSS